MGKCFDFADLLRVESDLLFRVNSWINLAVANTLLIYETVKHLVHKLMPFEAKHRMIDAIIRFISSNILHICFDTTLNTFQCKLNELIEFPDALYKYDRYLIDSIIIKNKVGKK